MSRINKGFWYFCTALMIVLCGYILWRCGFTMTYAENLKNIIREERLPYFLFGLALAGGVLFCLLAGKLEGLTQKQLRLIGAGAFGILIVVQLIFLIVFRTALRGDQMKVFEAAVELLESRTIGSSSYNEYFSRCSNNIPLALVTYFFVNIFRLLHLPESIWMDCAKAVGTAFLDGGLFFGYLLLKRLKNQKTAVLMLFLALFNPMLYLLTGVYYSSTISLFFAMCSLDVYFRGKDAQEKKWKDSLLVGILLGLGFKIRATAFICGIALAICAFLGWKNKEDIKKGLQNLAVTLAGFFLVLVLFSVLSSVYVQADYEDTEYTMLHYVMMGANGNGTYSPSDAAYTQSFEGKAAKNEANKEKLFKRIEEMGVSGVIQLFGRKLTVTFSDGADDYMDAFSGALKSPGHLKYLNGSKRDFLAGYCHVYNTMLWLGIFVSLFAGIGREKERKTFVIMLSALGGIAFQLIWECGEAYSVPYTILFLMMAAEGICFAKERLEKPFERKLFRRLALGGSAAAFLLSAVWIIRAFSGIVLVNDDYRVRQTTYELTIASADEVVEQTFTASEPFNEIELYVYNVMKEHNHSRYLVTLLGEGGEQIAQETIEGHLLPEYGMAYVQFDTVIPSHESIYTIRIEASEKDEKSGLVFPYHSTGIYDLYHGGSLYVNGKAYPNCDLAFTVYLRTESAGI